MSEAVTAPSGEQRACKGCGESYSADLPQCPKCGLPWGDEPLAASTAQVPANAMPQPPQNLEIGETLLGQWKLESKIGEGGMGNVFLATELKLGRKVAVKALHVDNLADETVKRFEREAQVMGKLDHPNIVTLYAVGRHRDVPFLVMRYLEGGSLWDLLDANGGRLTPEQLLPLVKQLCSALGYIHGKNLIHRDLKPSNIFISPQGKVTLLDLGLARGHTTALTRTGIIWGTPDFMAPEQIVGEKQLDGRADLYALSVVMYRMIANQPPFPDADEQDLMRAHLTRPRPDIAKVWFQATPALSLMLQKGMAIKPEDRYQTAEEFAQAFDRVVNAREQPTRAAPQAPAPSAPPRTSTGSNPALSAAPPAAPAPKGSTGLNVGHAPTAAAKPAPPPPAPPPPVPSAPAPAPAKTVTSATTAHVPKPTAAAKGKVIDELDDDATELGELPPELMAAIQSAELQNSEADSGHSSAITPVDPAPAVARAEAKKTEPTGTTPVPRKSVSAPPKPAAGPVPEKPGATRQSGSSTLFDRPPSARAPAAPDDDSARTQGAGYVANPPSDEDTRPPGTMSPFASGTMNDGEPITGPSPVEPEPALSSGPSGPMMVRTGDIEPDDDDADMKTVVGDLSQVEAAGMSTSVVPAPAPLPVEPEKEPEPTTAMPPPQPKVSAPRPSRTNVPRRSTSSLPAQGRKEPTGVRGKAEPPADESPPWMHPYVLVTGGLLLLALGFLIGVLLR